MTGRNWSPGKLIVTKRFKTLIFVVVGWLALNAANWGLTKYLDSIATPQNVNTVLEYISASLSYVSGSFGIGFIIGAFIFSIWDWPFIIKLVRKFREANRNREEDNKLSAECEEISKYLYEQAVALERIRNDTHWASVKEDDHEKAWREARVSESREEERIRRQIGPRVQNVIVTLKQKGVKMDLWGLSLGHHDLTTASYFFADLAKSSEEGDYLEREFKAGRAGLPPRL